MNAVVESAPTDAKFYASAAQLSLALVAFGFACFRGLAATVRPVS
jgi:hypothetical protein